jgi:DNA-directed RNA polymerase subunit H (RpoH/RPB5)
MTQSGFSVQICNSRSNLLDILRDRGFDIEKYVGSSIAEVHAMFQHDQLDMLLENKDTKKKVYVKYHLGKTLRPNNIYDFTTDLFEDEKILSLNDDLIVIARADANDTLQKTLKNIWTDRKYFVTVFGLEALQFNPLEHVLVPPHKVMGEDEAFKIKQKYNIMDDSQIPDISRFSPIAAAIGIRPGQLCEILRPSKTAVTAPFYRICSA